MKSRKIFEPFLLLSKAERNGAIVLLLIIGLLLSIWLLLPLLIPTDESAKADLENKIRLLDDIDDTAPRKSNRYSKKEFKQHSYAKARTNRQYSVENTESKNELNPEAILSPFDPNLVTYEELTSLGFSSFAARNLVNYRSKGGTFESDRDLLKVYGVDSAFWLKLVDYIVITEPSPKELIELNSADSASLTMLTGIGPVFASRICKYRNLLGGFITSSQLREIYQFSDETYNKVLPQIRVDASAIKKINVNFASIGDLKKHPYCNYNQARKIVDYRSSVGFLNSVEVLLSDSVIDQQTYDRFSPYLKIE